MSMPSKGHHANALISTYNTIEECSLSRRDGTGLGFMRDRPRGGWFTLWRARGMSRGTGLFTWEVLLLWCPEVPTEPRGSQNICICKAWCREEHLYSDYLVDTTRPHGLNLQSKNSNFHTTRISPFSHYSALWTQKRHHTNPSRKKQNRKKKEKNKPGNRQDNTSESRREERNDK